MPKEKTTLIASTGDSGCSTPATLPLIIKPAKWLNGHVDVIVYDVQLVEVNAEELIDAIRRAAYHPEQIATQQH